MNIDLTSEQVEKVVAEELRDSLRHPKDLEPSLESAMIIVLAYYSVPEGVEE
jgi:hypothetical protein